MKPNNSVIDLTNDDSPEQPTRQHGCSGELELSSERTAAPRPSAQIDVDHNLSPHSGNSPASQYQRLKPCKRKRSTNDIGKSDVSRRLDATKVIKPLQSSQRSSDGGLITYNLLDFIDQFRSNDVLTINGNSNIQSKPSVSGNNNNSASRQLFHYTQNDRWSCGFRNLQMIISSMPTSLNQLFPDGVPTLNELQSSFELLWAEGFDPNGASHHKNSMVGKTGKISWIGAVEVWSYLSFRGIDATIVQFANTMQNRATIGSFVWAYFSRLSVSCECQSKNTQLTTYQSAKQLTEFAKQVRESTDNTPNVLTCNCPLLPLYLQWSGHSVTIVGIRRVRYITGDGETSTRYLFIVFDPQKNGEMLRDKLIGEINSGLNNTQPNGLHFMELSSETLLRKDTQIIVSNGRVINDWEREQCKERVRCVSVVV